MIADHRRWVLDGHPLDVGAIRDARLVRVENTGVAVSSPMAGGPPRV
jgi:hypothetical protein